MGMSTQFSIDLARDSKLGLSAGVVRGWYPGYPVLGEQPVTPQKGKASGSLYPILRPLPACRRNNRHTSVVVGEH